MSPDKHIKPTVTGLQYTSSLLDEQRGKCICIIKSPATTLP